MRLGNLIKGLQLIEKYEGAGAYCMNAVNDQMFVGDYTKFSPEDRDEMFKLGWIETMETDWAEPQWSAYL